MNKCTLCSSYNNFGKSVRSYFQCWWRIRWFAQVLDQRCSTLKLQNTLNLIILFHFCPSYLFSRATTAITWQFADGRSKVDGWTNKGMVARCWARQRASLMVVVAVLIGGAVGSTGSRGVTLGWLKSPPVSCASCCYFDRHWHCCSCLLLLLIGHSLRCAFIIFNSCSSMKKN